MTEFAIELIGGDKKEPEPAPAPPSRDEAAARVKAMADEEDRKRALVALGAAGTIFGGPSLATSEAAGAKTLGGS